MRETSARVVLTAVIGLMAACDRGASPETGPIATPAPEPVFVGGEACASCHAEEVSAWRGSHHDLAMQPADASTVMGDFDDAVLREGESTMRFLQRDDSYLVSTEGPDGLQEEYAVSHTFGASPLQQYLVELPGGRLQALPVAWDSRPAAEGGQRWFHLYPGEVIDYENPLHWTGVYLRWNTMCADCHSTNLQKRYDSETDRFETRFSSIDVGCEACHGPGSAHAADPAVPPPALPARAHQWAFTPAESIASRVPSAAPATDAEPGGLPAPSADEIGICARCHSLRTQLTDAHEPGEPLLDAYRPSLLEEGLYHADGQIEDEVYVYGSFLQSRMAAAGVTCSDCHEPHSGRLRAEGNAVCAGCHRPTAYDVPAHHRHESGTAGAECTACHMRAETYMIVDPRRDHSFRVPRPDLSASIGAPNACIDCHAEQSNEWAAARVAEWFPAGRQTEPHYGEALHAARTWAYDARARLLVVIEDGTIPGIARATALGLLGQRLSPADRSVLERSLEDDDPLVRLAAIEASAALPAAARANLVQRFLTDARRALRIAAARSLVAARLELSERRRADLDRAVSEYLAVQTFHADRPEGPLNAAAVLAEQGRDAEAQTLLVDAIERFPRETALHVNLAEIYRETNRADEAERILRVALDENPDDALAAVSLGFALVRAGSPDEALGWFEQAEALRPDEPYYAYVLAIAHNDAGATERAVALLRDTHERFPGHADTLYALATMLRDAGDDEAAYRYAVRLDEVLPGDQGTQQLLRELEQRL